MKKFRTKFIARFLINAGAAILISCVHSPLLDPGGEIVDPDPTTGCTNAGQVCFESSVLPIFVSSCARSGCHDARSGREGYVLDTYANITRRGITPGNASNSKLYKVLFESGEDRMPPDGSLTQAQKDSIKLWINQGAKNTTNCSCFCDTTQFTYSASIKLILQNACVGCHKSGSLGGGINLSSYADVKTQVDNGRLLGSILHTSGYTAMPQGGTLPECEITKIEKWVTGGAPNN